MGKTIPSWSVRPPSKPQEKLSEKGKKKKPSAWECNFVVLGFDMFSEFNHR